MSGRVDFELSVLHRPTIAVRKTNGAGLCFTISTRLRYGYTYQLRTQKRYGHPEQHERCEGPLMVVPFANANAN